MFFSGDGGLGQELKELLLMRGLRGRDILAETLLAGIDGVAGASAGKGHKQVFVEAGKNERGEAIVVRPVSRQLLA